MMKRHAVRHLRLRLQQTENEINELGAKQLAKRRTLMKQAEVWREALEIVK
jgi:hypothetical protein